MTFETGHTTIEKLLRMSKDGLRDQLVRGELRKTTPARDKHGYLASRIASRLERHVEDNNLGRAYTTETGFKLASNPDTGRASDASFVSQAHLDETVEIKGYWPGASDLTDEVTSPSEPIWRSSIRPSLGESGSQMVLVVDPGQQTMKVYRALDDLRILQGEAGETHVGADVVPGWGLPVAESFV